MTRACSLLIAIAFFLSGCVNVSVKKTSPAEYGYGIQTAPGWQLGNSNTSVHGWLSYNHLNFDGGHDNLYQIGGQVRQSLLPNDQGGLWFGGEAAYVHFTSIYDDELFVPENPGARGFSLGGLLGYKFPAQSVPFSIYAGVGLVHFGDFATDDIVFDEGGNGFSGRIGVYFHLMSLIHEKGR